MHRAVRKAEVKPPPIDAAMLHQARRLVLRAAAVKADERAQILALVDDIQTLRDRLLAECVRLDQEMKRANVTTTALRAYAQGAVATRTRRN
jgi:hypothetical protein